MLGKTDKNPQLNIGEIPLVHFINKDHELGRFSKKINWENVEKEFSVFYSSKGAPSIPMRIMVGVILLKRKYGYPDKGSIEQWIENPYWQHFCGEVYFQHKPPLHHSDFSHFKRRIGSRGEAMISSLGEEVFGQAYSRNSNQKNKHKSSKPKSPVSGFFRAFHNFWVRITG